MGEEKTSLWYNRRVWRVDGRMTKQQARRILEAGAPDMSYEMRGQEQWLWQKGDIIWFSTELEVEILKVNAHKGRWRVNYLVRDHRPKLLGKQTGYTDDPGRAIAAKTYDEDGIHREAEAVEAPEKDPEQDRIEAHERRLRSLTSEMAAAPGPGARARIRNKLRRAA